MIGDENGNGVMGWCYLLDRFTEDSGVFTFLYASLETFVSKNTISFFWIDAWELNGLPNGVVTRN